MMHTIIGLDEIKVGECAVVHELQNPSAMRQRLQDLGLIEETAVECIGKAPGGALCAYLIRGAVIAIRASDARFVRVLPRFPQTKR